MEKQTQYVKREAFKTTLARVKKEMALPRIVESARIIERDLAVTTLQKPRLPKNLINVPTTPKEPI